MILQDYIAMQERCSNCSYCKWIPFDKVRSTQFAENCPANCYYKFNTYSARGRFQLGLAINNGELDYSGQTQDIVRQCLSCGACDVSCKICRYNLEPLEHTIALKEDAVKHGAVTEKQKELIASLKAEQTMMPERLHKDRTAWADGLSLKNACKDGGEVLFFPGCRYSYDENLREDVRFAVKLLQGAGVDLCYKWSTDTCCAGRAYQMGFLDDFNQRAAQNKRALANAGIKKIVTPCADCYHALMRLYPQVEADCEYNIEVVHISQMIAELISEGRISFTNSLDVNVTYHDPCHLGRQGEPYVFWEGKEKKILNQIHTWEPRRPRYNGAHGVYDAPREVIKAIPGVKLTEMERIREYSWCCGAGGACGETDTDFARFTANERVKEALSTGADYLVTACPWCETTLSELPNVDDGNIRVMSLLGLIRLSFEGRA